MSLQIDLGLHVKCPIFLLDFNQASMFSRFSKNNQISNFVKIRPVGAELLYADGRTEITKLIVAFRNFANAPKMFARITNLREYEVCRGS
jgi:hypothetical protein